MARDDYQDRLGDYKEVADRLADLKAVHPDARLRPLDPARPFWIEMVPFDTTNEDGDVVHAGRTFIVYAAALYRDENDPLPAVGMAWEPFPGTTPYTRNSELQNAETSAWGRAIVAALRSSSKAVASLEDVQNRGAESAPTPAPSLVTHQKVTKGQGERIVELFKQKGWDPEVRKTYIERIIGHPLETANDMTAAEADLVLADLILDGGTDPGESS